VNLAEADARSLEEVEDRFCVFTAGHPILGQGENFQEMCFAFQGRAIIHLLENFDLKRYRWQLQRSVHARLYFLRKMQEQKSLDPVFMALSRTESLFDAIASDDLASPAQLRALSPDVWQPDGEYEDDFWYYEVVHALANGAQDEAVTHAAQLEVAIDGANDPRLQLCKSFIEAREDDFWDSFSDYMEQRQEACALPPFMTSFVGEPWRLAFIHFSVQGVAWLKLAKARGFRQPQDELLMCPSIALSERKTDPAPNVFVQVEAQFGL